MWFGRFLMQKFKPQSKNKLPRVAGDLRVQVQDCQSVVQSSLVSPLDCTALSPTLDWNRPDQ